MLCVIPARGGSKELKRKNLRVVAGKPLVLHALDNVRAALPDARIVCTTDDATIATIARLHGYEVHDRPAHLAGDEATIADVAHGVQADLKWIGPVAVFQPTSPTLAPETIRRALNAGAGLTVVEDTHTFVGDVLANRQYREPRLRQTGGIRMLDNPVPYIIPVEEAIDIDTAADLATAAHVLNRKRVEFRIAYGPRVGSGHLRRALALADELPHHVGIDQDHGYIDGSSREIAAYGYGLPHGKADLVIFDKLDTTVREVAEVKAQGAAVMCLEDLGPGAALADVVVNELYDTGLCGPRYAVLRPEFLALPPHPIRDVTRDRLNILVTFGGTDPAGLVPRCEKVLQATAANIATVGPDDVMAEKMHDADLIVTSCGRTVHEAAAVGVPCIAIAANARESRHSLCPGVVYLGLHVTVSDRQIAETADAILGDVGLRAEMSETMRGAVDGRGVRRIAHLAEGLLEGL